MSRTEYTGIGSPISVSGINGLGGFEIIVRRKSPRTKMIITDSDSFNRFAPTLFMLYGLLRGDNNNPKNGINAIKP